jgi:nicotinate-nucleotide adenylyltransferase
MPAPLRIGLLGGSFNPAHGGHLHVSLEALKRLNLDQVWWLVSPQNPLKSKDGMAPYAERIASAKAQVHGHRKIMVSDFEARAGLHYTHATLKALKARYPDTQFVWLMGADNLAGFHRWQRWRDIIRLMPVAIFDRAPFSHTALAAKAEDQIAEIARHPGHWAYILIRRHPGSSTQIRAGKA